MELLRKPAGSSFAQQVEEAKAEAADLMASLQETCGLLSELDTELEALAQDTSELVEADTQMRTLLRKMGRKAESLNKVLGSF